MADVLEQYPMQRTAMMATLHRTTGSAFVADCGDDDEVGISVRDVNIDYAVPDVSKAEADFLWSQKYGTKPPSTP